MGDNDRDRGEQQRVLGIPVGAFSRDQDGEEPQRVLGMPVDWFQPAKHELRGFLERYVPGYRQRARRRRPGSRTPGEGEHQPKG
jgi:hypothetical protein